MLKKFEKVEKTEIFVTMYSICYTRVRRMTLKSLVVIFQTLEPMQSQWPLQPQQPRWPQCDLYSLISTTTTKNYWSWWLDPPWCQNDQYWSLLIESKILFFTDISTFSVRGCWRQAMLIFWKLGDETQKCKPPEATRHHNSIKLLILLSLRALLYILHYETPCRRPNFS